MTLPMKSRLIFTINVDETLPFTVSFPTTITIDGIKPEGHFTVPLQAPIENHAFDNLNAGLYTVHFETVRVGPIRLVPNTNSVSVDLVPGEQKKIEVTYTVGEN